MSFVQPTDWNPTTPHVLSYTPTPATVCSPYCDLTTETEVSAAVPPHFRAASLLRLWASSAHPQKILFLFSVRGRQLAFCCTCLCTVFRSWDHHMATFITWKMSEMNTANSFQLICNLTNQVLVAALYYVQVLEVVMHLISAHTMASMPFTWRNIVRRCQVFFSFFPFSWLQAERL